MLPTSYPYDRAALRGAWQAMCFSGCTPGFMDPAVVRSWERCRQAGLDPQRCSLEAECCSADEVEIRSQSNFDLIAIARPFMEDIFQFVGERGLVVFLGDADLCVLDTLGDLPLREAVREAGIMPGTFLGESNVGTNAAAVALMEGIAVQVVGAEHYCQPLHGFTDTAATIHAPHGQMLAVLGIATREQDSSPHTLGVVMAAAKAIENQMQADQSLSEALQNLARLDVALQAVSKGIIFLDPEVRIAHINPRAGDILRLPRRQATGRPLSSVLQLPQELTTALRLRKPMKERELIFLREERPCPCLVTMAPLWEGLELSGYVLTLEHSSAVRQLVHRLVGAQAHFSFSDLIGRDVKMRQLLQYARNAAQGDANVLLLGESGTGKDMFAQAIHNASRRAQGPFVSANCAGMPRELLARGLFGYAATSAETQREGRPARFELADGGTIFLDNVDGLPLEMQAHLLQVLDTKEVTRLGDVHPIPIDVRVIASSSNLNLMGETQKGRFRTDLFYRLNVLTLTIPPLRDRGNDILLLVAHLVDQFGERMGKEVRVSPEAMAILQSYHWPGNVRELENVLERAMHLLEGEVLEVEHLPAELSRWSVAGTDGRIVSLQEAERQAIIRAGRALQGNVSAMARVLGIGRTTLWRKMKALKLSPDSFKG